MAQCWRGPTLRSPEARPGTRKMRRSTAIDAVNVTFSCWTTRKSNRSNNKTIRYPRSCTSKTQFYDVQILPWGFNVVKTCEIKHRWIYQRVDCMSAQMAAYYWIYHWIWMRRYHPLLVSNHFASHPIYLIDWSRLKPKVSPGFCPWSCVSEVAAKAQLLLHPEPKGDVTRARCQGAHRMAHRMAQWGLWDDNWG